MNREYSLDGLGYSEIYQLQKALEDAMSRSLEFPKWMEDLHMSIINFWELEELHIHDQRNMI